DERRHGGAPLLVVRVAAEEDEAVLLGDEAPARRVAPEREAAVVVGGVDGARDEPAQRAGERAREQRAGEEGRDGARGRREEARAEPRDGAAPARRRRAVAGGARAGRGRALGRHRSTSATRRLYQPIAAAVARFSARYTDMMTTMHSSAWPFWLMAVFAIETRSG